MRRSQWTVRFLSTRLLACCVPQVYRRISSPGSPRVCPRLERPPREWRRPARRNASQQRRHHVIDRCGQIETVSDCARERTNSVNARAGEPESVQIRDSESRRRREQTRETVCAVGDRPAGAGAVA